jgi:hypothetical protein
MKDELSEILGDLTAPPVPTVIDGPLNEVTQVTEEEMGAVRAHRIKNYPMLAPDPSAHKNHTEWRERVSKRK